MNENIFYIIIMPFIYAYFIIIIIVFVIVKLVSVQLCLRLYIHVTLIVHYYCVLYSIRFRGGYLYQYHTMHCAHELHSTLLIATLDKRVLWVLAFINIHPLRATIVGIRSYNQNRASIVCAILVYDCEELMINILLLSFARGRQH